MDVWKPMTVVVGTGAAVALAVPPVLASHPGSGVDHSGGGADCSGFWTSRHPYQFGLRDNAGGSDDDWCYIDFGAGPGLGRRVSIPEDSSIGNWQYRRADMGGIKGQIYWRICEERQDDPDLCSSIHNNTI